uniref:EF-hand domain-containing protein n=1 Tax=Strombidium rassoulzadegani TaxID=1082188 RepID=A0A7S3CKL8_9SPIT|mmetsp:Transcript_14218/g.24178  ORF Transcript_14218/g.24178 Transcript_14218/m.24178 type:complete len:240 (+) Transcript_14218:757-1476(+)
MHGQYSGYFPEFDRNSSKELRSLIQNMIKLVPSERISSTDLVLDPWVNSAHQRYRQLSRSIVNTAFSNMRSFRLGYQLQRASLLHMAWIYISKKEREHLRMIFDALDEEKDGEIELKEFVIQLKEKFDIQVKVQEMEQIIKNCDLDGDGKIQFTEFIIACCNKKALLTTHNLAECFSYFDDDGDGVLSRNDLQEVLGEDLDEYQIGNILEDADDECLGKISIREFNTLMLKVLRGKESF